jgi:hypothetical protein
VRTEAHKIEMIVVRFSVDQNQIGLDMAITMIDPFSDKRMVVFVRRQRFVSDKQIDNFHQCGIKRFVAPP